MRFAGLSPIKLSSVQLRLSLPVALEWRNMTEISRPLSLQRRLALACVSAWPETQHGLRLTLKHTLPILMKINLDNHETKRTLHLDRLHQKSISWCI